jgi:hypothetical protein
VTNTLAIVLALLVISAIALDVSFGWGGTLFLARRLADLVIWLAFWR